MENSGSGSDFSCVMDFIPELGKLFVGGLSWRTDAYTFLEHFQQYGEVVECCIMYNPKTQKPRGFGFVTFKYSNVADKVITTEHVIDEKKVEVKRCTPKVVNRILRQKEDANNSRKVFLGGLPSCANEASLHKAFEQAFGPVEEVVVMCLPQHISKAGKPRSRGFGFVTFENEGSALSATRQKFLHVLGKQVEIKPAEPKNPCDQFYRSLHGGIELSCYTSSNLQYQAEAIYEGYPVPTHMEFSDQNTSPPTQPVSPVHIPVYYEPYEPFSRRNSLTPIAPANTPVTIYGSPISQSVSPVPPGAVSPGPGIDQQVFLPRSSSVSPNLRTVSPIPQNLTPIKQEIPIIQFVNPDKSSACLYPQTTPRANRDSISPIPQIYSQGYIQYRSGDTYPYYEIAYAGEPVSSQPTYCVPFDQASYPIPIWPGGCGY